MENRHFFKNFFKHFQTFFKLLLCFPNFPTIWGVSGAWAVRALWPCPWGPWTPCKDMLTLPGPCAMHLQLPTCFHGLKWTVTDRYRPAPPQVQRAVIKEAVFVPPPRRPKPGFSANLIDLIDIPELLDQSTIPYPKYRAPEVGLGFRV